MLRFTIRDVLWLTVVVGFVVALWVEYRNTALWRSRANGAAKALKDAERENSWYGNGLVVKTPAPGTDANVLRVYSGP